MKKDLVKGYVLVVFSGLVILAAVVEVVLQWAHVSQFSLYGYPYDIIVVDGKMQGGTNTALLMIGSAVGGVVILAMCIIMFKGIWALRRGFREAEKPSQSKLP